MEAVFDRGVHPLYAVSAFCCALIMFILISRTKIDQKGDFKKAIYANVFSWVLFYGIQDGVWGLFASHIFNSRVGLEITSTVFHLSSAVTCYIWVLFIIRYLGEENVGKAKLLKALTGTSVIIQACLIAINTFTKFMFYVDADGFYSSTPHRRILFYMQFAVYIIIGIITVAVMMKSRFDKMRENIVAVFCMNMAPLFFGFFQMLYPDAPANTIGFTIGCVIIFTFVAREYVKQVEEFREKQELQDIIEKQNDTLKQQQGSLKEALSMAEAANEAKSSFLFNMSHDIRTPMNAIIGYTDMALRHMNSEERVEDSLHKIRSSSDYLLSIINDVLNMARIESGKVKIEEEVVHVNEINDALTQMISVNAAAKDITVHSSAKDLVNEYIWTDKNHVNQIMSNLLSNAIKYTPSGGEIWHTVRQIPCDREGYGCLQTVIKDTGIGMSKEFQKKIFDEFEREENSTVSGIQGTGLGMSIVKKLVDLMSGKIEIESELGKGTCVTVTLEHRLATDDEIEVFKKQSSPIDLMKDVPLKGTKVLLVEDNEMNREIATEILEDGGMLVDTAEDGDIAVEKVKNAAHGQYDIILMDVQMPRMNGYEATKAIRRLDDNVLADIPIIAMTANAFEEDRQHAFEAGMNEHIAKPIDIKKMMDVINKYVS